jgi:hypothetical protein
MNAALKIIFMFVVSFLVTSCGGGSTTADADGKTSFTVGVKGF